MADSFTPVLNMNKPEIDGSPESWGQKLNADLDLLDQFAGTMNVFKNGNDARINALIASAIPHGVILAWWGGAGTVPTGWLLCNGTNGTPDLTDRFILGNTGNRANMEGGGAFQGTHATDAQGSHQHTGVVTDTAITTDQMPSHQHGGHTDAAGDHAHGYRRTNEGTGVTGGGIPAASEAYFGARTEATDGAGYHGHNIISDFRGNNQGHAHGVYWDGNHAHNVTVNVVPPYLSLCYIMRA